MGIRESDEAVDGLMQMQEEAAALVEELGDDDTSGGQIPMYFQEDP